jgi:uncharacterized protein (TIGR00255 family)
MTGFGRCTTDSGRIRIVCEARSVNSRGLQTSLRVPEQFSRHEEEIRELVRSLFARGRIEVTLSFEDLAGGEPSPEVNMSRAGIVAAATRFLAVELGIPFELTAADLIRVPGVLVPAGSSLPAGDDAPVMECVGACLEELHRSRLAEGESISAVFNTKLTRVRHLASQVMENSQGRVEERFRKLRERVAQLVEGIPLDNSRLAQELAFIADRLDISEEYQRLSAHIENCLALLGSGDSDSGRKLSFLLQELQREANTLGSKLDESSAVLLAVEIKNELASLREQVANVD